MHDLSETDEELMAQYQLGSEDAFVVLYSRHSSKIFGYICKYIPNRERAAEAFQEVFAKMHKSKHLYNSTLPFMPWLFSVSRSVTLDVIRSDTRRDLKTVSFKQMTSESRDFENQGEHKLIELKPQLASLPDSQRIAVEMRFVDEKTFEEIANRLNTSPMNARKLISRGVKRLKELIQEGDKP
ncbi:MAG: sigma-70 family RNA polymerase sigma factor [Patescibacteria group bacterium]